MIESIRTDIAGLGIGGSCANLSLLFNRLCPGIDEQGEHSHKDRTINAMLGGYSAEGYHDLYKHALSRWRKTIAASPDIVCFEMEVSSPLVVGKGDQNVHEFGISLQLPWGTPLIPGSAVKGVLSSFAHEQGGGDWNKGALAARDNGIDAFSGQLSLLMFGGMDSDNNTFAGCLDFYDAWWVPGTGNSPFAEDIINVHNRSYYQAGKSWPAGVDSPVPNKFVVVRPGEKFLFAVKGTKNWRELAKDMLTQAAAAYGFGAKTRVGYGRMKYIKTDADLQAEMAEYDTAELAALFKEQAGNQGLKSAFQAEAEKRSYDPQLDKLFRKFKPFSSLLHKLRAKQPADTKSIKNIYEEHRKILKGAAINKEDPVVQEIFQICHPVYMAEDKSLPSWLTHISPTAADLLAGKSVEQIEELLDTYQQQWPPLKDFKEAIEESGIDAEGKEYLLELYFDESGA
jgi:CRISPR-associated protein Cmr6